MDACTVTALGAITAFAVPNPGGHLATPSVFSGLAVRQVAKSQPITQRTSGRLHLCCQPFSAVDMSDANTAIAIVNAEGWCKCTLFSCGNYFLQIAQKTWVSSPFRGLSEVKSQFFHRIQLGNCVSQGDHKCRLTNSLA